MAQQQASKAGSGCRKWAGSGAGPWGQWGAPGWGWPSEEVAPVTGTGGSEPGCGQSAVRMDSEQGSQAWGRPASGLPPGSHDRHETRCDAVQPLLLWELELPISCLSSWHVGDEYVRISKPRHWHWGKAPGPGSGARAAGLLCSLTATLETWGHAVPATPALTWPSHPFAGRGQRC